QMIAVAPGFGGYNVGGFGSLNGTRPNQINWQINGVDNNDFWHNIPAINQGGVSGIAGTVLPIDATEEFSVQTSSGPEGGRNAGGTANIVLKSGTNDIHGSLYYYNRTNTSLPPRPSLFPRPEPRRQESARKTTASPRVARSSRTRHLPLSPTRRMTSCLVFPELQRNPRMPG